MQKLSSQFASHTNSEQLVFEIFNADTWETIAELEKKDTGKFELFIASNTTVDGVQFLKLLEKGIKEL